MWFTIWFFKHLTASTYALVWRGLMLLAVVWGQAWGQPEKIWVADHLEFSSGRSRAQPQAAAACPHPETRSNLLAMSRCIIRIPLSGGDRKAQPDPEQPRMPARKASRKP